VKPLRVVIDARLISGSAGGVESVTAGLVAGLTGLPDGDEQYGVLVIDGHDDWIRPYVGDRVQLISVRPTGRAARLGVRGLAKRLVPSAAYAWRRRPILPGERIAGPPPSDGSAERWGGEVVHLIRQGGFLTPLPTIYHPHDFQHRHLPQFFTERERRHRDLWYATLCGRASMVAVASSWAREDAIRQLGLPPDRVEVVPLAPPTSALDEPTPAEVESAQTRLALPAEFIYYPAQTWPHKNHLGLVEALARLRERGLVVPIVFSGTLTPHASVIRQRVAELGLTNQVRWLGFIAAADVRRVYELARAVVIPTRFEAASAPLWEAFLAGVPAACSNVTSLPRQAGDAALLFAPDDVEAMAAAIATLWRDEVVRATLVRRGAENVRRFNWGRTARHFRAHYRRLAGRNLTDDDQALLSAPPLL
jgi:glycosyltransferase involved in cell wall biosynthesis